MIKKITFLGILFLISGLATHAQNSISGKVIDARTNIPLAGASISIPGNKIITTGLNGAFTISCSENVVITVSYIGYQTQKVKTACNEDITIAMSESVNTLENIEITATSNQNKSLLYQPVSITKLSETELKRGNGLFLDDAINGNVPGVTMNRRAVSSGQQFNIRGYGNGVRGTRGISSNFDGQGYKVYLNGIPVTDAEGITTMDDVDFGSLGNVEVVKGPAGTLYGLAIAGVVNLKTIKPEKGQTSVGQDLMIGNYGLQRYTTQFQTSGDHSSILINYGHQLSEGFTIHNNSRKNFINFTGDFQPNARQNVSSYFGYSNSYDERSGELTIAQYDASDYSGNIEYIKRNGHSNVYTLRAGLEHSYIFNNHISNTTTIFGTSFNSNVSSAGGWTDKSATNFGIRSTFNTKFFIGNEATLSGITGTESQRQNAQTIGYTMVKNPLDTNSVWVYGNPYYWVIGTSTSNIYTTTATTSLFTEWTLSLPENISITAGIGYSNMKISLDDRFYNAATPNRTRRYDTSYQNMFSPHLAINKVIRKDISFYASYSKGYKAPVSSYFYIPYASGFAESGVVNNRLQPESGNQFEIGSKGTIFNRNLVYQFAVFAAILSNKMTAVAVPYNSSTTLYSYVTNGGKQKNKGAELLLKYTAFTSTKGFLKMLGPYGNITVSDFKYGSNFKYQSISGNTVTTVDYSNKNVAGVPELMGNAGVDVGMAAGLYANINYLYKDGFPITSDAVFKTSAYNLLNAKLGIRQDLSKNFELHAFFGINNITGTKFPIMVFVNQIPDAYVAGPAKANYFGGINLRYIFRK
jgi:iron complex outermembrane receptor protein